MKLMKNVSLAASGRSAPLRGATRRSAALRAAPRLPLPRSTGLSAVADQSRILFGTDYPYVSPDVVTGESRSFDAWDGFTDAQRAAVNRGNAETLFPRFSAI